MTTTNTSGQIREGQDRGGQIRLPGQTHVAEGPHDQTGMYLAHHAFRRDLGNVESAVRHTPVDDVGTWQALERRWGFFASVLHHHHTVEDDHIWPVLTARVEAAGDDEAVALLAAMEAEHEQIDPALRAVAAGLAAMGAGPSEDQRGSLVAVVSAARAALLEHLRHEETEALPLLQRVMTEEEFAASEKAALDEYGFRDILMLVPWVAAGVPDEIAAGVLRKSGLGYALILRLFCGRFERFERQAFRYA